MAGGSGVQTIAPDGCGGFRKRATRPHEWTPARKAAFLDHLAMTCNVTASAIAAGMHKASPYALRRRDPAFAAAWAAAIGAGTERLHEQLVAYALRGLDGAGVPGAAGAGEAGAGDAGGAPFDPMLALRILGLSEKDGAGARRHTHRGPAYKQVPPEEVERALIAKLDRIAARDADADADADRPRRA